MGLEISSTSLILLARPRLACAMVLGSKWEHFVVLLGVCCSTFVSISRGSTFRSSFLPQGCPISIAVYKANKALCRQSFWNTFVIGSAFITTWICLESRAYLLGKKVCPKPWRTVLLLLLIVAADGVFIVENPHSTLLNAQRRFQQLVEMLRARGICILVEFVHVVVSGPTNDYLRNHDVSWGGFSFIFAPSISWHVGGFRYALPTHQRT